MTTIEKIRAEIERRKNELPEQDVHTTVGADSIRMAAIYDDLLSFLDTLPELPEGLEEAAKEYAILPMDVGEGKVCIDKKVKRAFIAGAEWKKEQMMDEWLKDRDGCFWDGVEEGKKAMEKQMLENAVDGEIVKDINNKLGVTAKCINLDGFKFGDKVIVQIRKK